MKRATKATRLIGLILFAYAICVFPSSFVYMIFTFAPSIRVQETPFIYIYPWVTFLNSAMNPFFYFFITQDLRNRGTRIYQQYLSFWRQIT